MDAALKRMQDENTKVFTDIDKEYIRKMQPITKREMCKRWIKAFGRPEDDPNINKIKRCTYAANILLEERDRLQDPIPALLHTDEQKEMYQCSAKCCDDRHGSIDDVQRCIKNCSSKLESAQEFIQGEVENFERRLQRCAMDCQDKARDKMMPNLAPAEQAVLKTEMESCVAQCAESGIKSLPDLGKRLKQYLNNLK